jgi:antitoxin HigA-1
MRSMSKPPHPGLTLGEDILPGLNLQVGEAAAELGVERTTLSKGIYRRGAIHPSMAPRIERWLGRDHGGAAEVWLAQQAACAISGKHGSQQRPARRFRASRH